MIEHKLSICLKCGLVYGNGWLLCPVCRSQSEPYTTAYSEIDEFIKMIVDEDDEMLNLLK
jgi:RNA polymerase subunit RPABC4/transcription elongation factor Spt4